MISFFIAIAIINCLKWNERQSFGAFNIISQALTQARIKDILKYNKNRSLDVFGVFGIFGIFGVFGVYGALSLSKLT